MKIVKMKTNHIENPLGYNLDKVVLSYVACDTQDTKQIAAQIEVALDENFKNIIFDSGKDESIKNIGYELNIDIKPRTRYFWRVSVWGDNGDFAKSNVSWFESSKMQEKWNASWITPNMDKNIHPVIEKEFTIKDNVKRARAYVCGLGLYEMNLNLSKVGNEYLTPNCNSYNKWMQYQTYDITKEICTGKNNVEFILGNGWYKGRFGFDGGEEEIYGDKFALICEIIVEYNDGTSEIIKSDNSWTSRESKIKFSGIYDGEFYDDSFIAHKTYTVSELYLGFDKLVERLSIPVVIKEKIKPIKIIHTPNNETVLDMGQNMVGWIEFKNKAPKGTEILLQYGEILQDDNFYRDNLRTAKAEFKYISDGEEKVVRPHFTYYGFRYVKICGLKDINIDDFVGCVLYSDMDATGSVETSNELVNRLFLNALWGQKGNFLDVPTDCPQRDERMGWTGDAQVFSGTATFNMDTYAFFTKYLHDLKLEQKSLDGMVPMVIPNIIHQEDCSSAWGDVACIIPWNMYIYYGDKTILERQFDSMKSWVDFIKRDDDNNGANRLWDSRFHFGDWLALDGENPDVPTGGTEETFIASAYYCYSARIVSKAAKVLGYSDAAEEYGKLSEEVKNAIIDEYFTKNGRLALKNQTAYIVALFMDLVPKEHIKRVADDLALRLKQDKEYLKTGFVGTPYICRVLSENGYNELAYKLLLNKDCPSWLYPVLMGATTIWERWDSVLPDGKISGTDMNSLNHYSYGSIAEWMYRNMCGINPVEDVPGFKRIVLAPMPDYRFKFAKAKYDSISGEYKSEWTINDDGSLNMKFTVPFDCTADILLPNARLEKVMVNNKKLSEYKFEIYEDKYIRVPSGEYNIEYMPETPYIKYYSVDMSLIELLKNEDVKKVFEKDLKTALELPDYMVLKVGDKSIWELSHMPFFNATEEEINKANAKIGKIKVIVE